MIMTHDAGSGYLGEGLVNRWTKTQPVGLAAQLECGARAFDARPMYKDGRVVWHHGSVTIDYEFSRSLDDMTDWLAEHPSELAIMMISDCQGGDGCMTGVRASLAARNITDVSDCGGLSHLTLGGAQRRGALPRGGAVIVITGAALPNGVACSNGNYDPSISCSGAIGRATRAAVAQQCGVAELALTAVPLAPRTVDALAACARRGGVEPNGFGCWVTDATRSKPIRRLLAYLDGVASKPLQNHTFTQSQALWQESAESVVIGTLRNSSLLIDEARSQLNALLEQQVRARRWAHLNLLEINNVCDGGPALWKAIRDVYYAPPIEAAF